MSAEPMSAAAVRAAADQVVSHLVVSHLADAHKHLVAAAAILDGRPDCAFTDGCVSVIGQQIEVLIECMS